MSKREVILNSLLGIASGLPLNVAYFSNKRKERKIKEIIQHLKIDHIYVQLIRAVQYVKNQTDIPMSIDYMDAFSLRIERKIDLSSVLRPFWKWEQRKLLEYEQKVQNLFEKKFVISRVDQQHFEQNGIKNTSLLANGVDTDYFTPNSEGSYRYDFVFVGNLSYQPNVEAVLIISNLARQLAVEYPDIKFLIAGSSPNRKVLACASDHVDILSDLKDIREAYWSAPVLIAPIFLGSGMQNKILEALACGLVCITTIQVMKAFQAPDDLLIAADSEAEFMAEMKKLYPWKNDNKRIEKGVAFVRNEYSWEKSNLALQFE